MTLLYLAPEGNGSDFAAAVPPNPGQDFWKVSEGQRQAKKELLLSKFKEDVYLNKINSFKNLTKSV